MSATLAGFPSASSKSMKVDTLARILGHLCKQGAVDRGDDHVLRDYVEAESRSFAGEKFNRFASEILSRIHLLIQR
jgi:hypothetical protein